MGCFLDRIMTCILGENEQELRRNNKLIEREMKRDKKNSRKEIKLLLLGTGEAGKSTFIKQMQIIHKGDYSEAEAIKFIPIIYRNIFMAMQSMIMAMSKLNVQYSDVSNTKYAELIKSVDSEIVTTFENQYAEAVKALWADSGIQNCYARSREYQLIDSAKYYLDKVDRISEPTYIPNRQDILRSREATTGLKDYVFTVEEPEKRTFRIIDVGGQKDERRKWIHCFEDVRCFIYLVAISEYDQFLQESEDSNRLKESLELYKVLIKDKWLKTTPSIIFFNKTDIFEEKIMVSHLKDYFPEYEGPPRDKESAKKFIKSVFITADPERKKNKNQYTHFTCATDTENIKFVFSAVTNIILKIILDRFETF